MILHIFIYITIDKKEEERTEEQTMKYSTLHRKLKIEQHEHHYKPKVNSKLKIEQHEHH